MPMQKEKTKIAVGLSGGVDSSVTAALLKDQGYDVIGVHMLRWDDDIPGCTGSQDRQDALKVAKKIGIPFRTVDFSDSYKKYVVDRFLSEIEKGLSPNPDVWCNEYIKFGVFMDYALKDLGVDLVATGHYARVQESDGIYELMMGTDITKDQSYFLYRLTQEQLSRTVFPLGGMLKSQVRDLAQLHNLNTAHKKDSVGICFIGDIDIKEFIKERIVVRPGNVVLQSGEVVGTHEGVLLYTVGQRSGFTLTSYTGDPLYVVRKNIEKNELVVGRDSGSEVTELFLTDSVGSIITRGVNQKIGASVRIRHLGELVGCELVNSEDGTIVVSLAEPVRGVSPGQHAVLYNKNIVIGGGIIARTS